MSTKIEKVIIVAAGPCGLLTALMLGKEGIQVDILEAAAEVNHAPRGLAYGPAATRVFARADILNKIVERGYVANQATWKDIEGSVLATWSVSAGQQRPVEDRTVVYPVGSLTALLAEELDNMPLVRIYWSSPVTGVGQDDDTAWANVRNNNGDEEMFRGDVT